jgi:carbon storage regulator CsrA
MWERLKFHNNKLVSIGFHFQPKPVLSGTVTPGLVLNGVKMLVLTRRKEEITYFDFSAMTDAELLSLRATPLRVIVVDTRADRVKLGFDAPDPVKINREEIYKSKKLLQAQNQNEILTQ